jgi:microsomal epoxide hydrolase
MAGYDTFPEAARLRPEPFQLKISDEQLTRFKNLLHLSPLAPRTYENLQEDGRFGVTYEWISKAKDHWENKYDW